MKYLGKTLGGITKPLVVGDVLFAVMLNHFQTKINNNKEMSFMYTIWDTQLNQEVETSRGKDKTIVKMNCVMLNDRFFQHGTTFCFCVASPRFIVIET